MSAPYGPGFSSARTEYSDHRPEVEGAVPRWLSGALIRNGPGLFESGGERVNHWFDGLAMLRRYAFADGEVTYTTRFLRTEAYADARDGELTGQFGTHATGWRRLLSWVRSLGPPTPTDNANVHVARLGGEYVALTEAPRRVAFDPVTLETRGEFAFADDLPEHVAAAHLVDDPRGGTVGFALAFGREPAYHVYRVPPGGRSREVIASVPAAGPGYVHDCSVTRDHVVLVEPPLKISLLKALSPFTEGVADALEWQGDRAARVLVIDRETGDLLADPAVGSSFTFHHVNAYAEEGAVVLDLTEYPDAAVVGAMALDELDAGYPDVPDARLVRYRVDTGSGAVERSRLYDGGLEMPRVFPGDVGGRHRYAYGQVTDRAGANGLAKVDCRAGTAREWWERSVYVEEPVPVRRPGGRADEGVVLAPALDAARERSMLLVFDAATLDVLARVHLPAAEPFGFHGRYFPEA